jgi:hypothetical protein
MGDAQRQDYLDALFLHVVDRKLDNIVAALRSRWVAVCRLAKDADEAMTQVVAEARLLGLEGPDALKEAERVYLRELRLVTGPAALGAPCHADHGVSKQQQQLPVGGASHSATQQQQLTDGIAESSVLTPSVFRPDISTLPTGSQVPEPVEGQAAPASDAPASHETRAQSLLQQQQREQLESKVSIEQMSAVLLPIEMPKSQASCPLYF